MFLKIWVCVGVKRAFSISRCFAENVLNLVHHWNNYACNRCTQGMEWFMLPNWPLVSKQGTWYRCPCLNHELRVMGNFPPSLQGPWCAVDIIRLGWISEPYHTQRNIRPDKDSFMLDSFMLTNEFSSHFGLEILKYSLWKISTENIAYR